MRSSTARPDAPVALRAGDRLRVLWVAKGGAGRPPAGGEPLPAERFWGYTLLEREPGIDVVARPVDERARGVLARAASRLRRRPSGLGYSALPAGQGLTAAARDGYDVVMSFHHAANVSLLSLRRSGHLRARLVCLGIGMADWLEGVRARARAHALALLSYADRVMVMSPGEMELLHALGLESAVHLPFGVDTDYWSPAPEEDEGYVLAVGSDPGRDFRTLVAACRGPLRIMTQATHLLPSPLPPNVSLVQGDTDHLRRLYASARAVAVPLRDQLQPSGQNTVLQAMATAKPVVLTRTRGLWSDRLVDGENCLLVEPGDGAGLGEAVRRLHEDPTLARAIGARARRTVEEHFGADRFGEALAAIVRGAADA